MRYYQLTLLLFSVCMAVRPGPVFAQHDTKAGTDTTQQLFNTDDILHFKLTGKLNELYKDISDKNTYHPVLLQLIGKDSNEVSLQITAKTRGHFRKEKGNCTQPPLLLSFPSRKATKNTPFENQTKLKLVVPCRGDEYVIEEYLVYKVYNLLSKNSFHARLALVDFEDSSHRRKTETHYCFLLENENPMAARNSCFVLKKKMLMMESTDADEFRKMAVFQYLIGNTDWGVPYLQNIVLIAPDSLTRPFTVPYDFDHAGIVDPPYAGPAPDLELNSILDRLYRGYCEKNLSVFNATFALFNRVKPDIYNVYTNCSLLSAKYIKFVKRYLDDFYSTINNKRTIETEFGKPCTTDQRVEIKGLKK